MLIITSGIAKIARAHAVRTIQSLNGPIAIDKSIMEKERSVSERDRIEAIMMRTVISGDTEKAFRKACKCYRKSTGEHLRLKLRDSIWEAAA